jgi:hypothetical protein
MVRSIERALLASLEPLASSGFPTPRPGQKLLQQASIGAQAELGWDTIAP